METSVDLSMDPFVDSNGGFKELTVLAPATESSQVHALDSKGIQVLVQFGNGSPPIFEKGVVITVWNHCVRKLSSGLEVIDIDMRGPCRWVWKSKRGNHTDIKPNFGELFSGLGGWSRGLQAMKAQPKVLVESNEVVAAACAASFGLKAIKASDLYDDLCKGIRPPECIIVGDLTDPKIWTLLSYYDLHVLCMSPPCQPWSKAARETGLDVKDGKAFAVVFFYAGKLGIKIINVENVGNILNHPHFGNLLKYIGKNGFQVLHSGKYEVHPFLAIKRERWLATFGLRNIPVPGSIKESADHVKFPVMSTGPASMRHRDCIQQHFENGEWNRLLPCPDAIMKLSNPELLPQKFVRTEGQTVYQSRVNNGEYCMGGAMAMYGKQHTLPTDLLIQKGLFTTLIATIENGNIPRYYSAWEILSTMAWPMNTVLPSDKHDAWHAAGNAISIPHTVLCLFKMHGVLQGSSPWGNEFFSLKKICAGVFTRAIKLSNMIPCTVSDLTKLQFVQEAEEGRVQDSPSRHVQRSFNVSPVVSPDVGVPRSNPFARVHDLPQHMPTKESLPFMSMQHNRSDTDACSPKNSSHNMRVSTLGEVKVELNEVLGETEQLIHDHLLQKNVNKSVANHDIFQQQLASGNTVIDIDETDEENFQPKNLANAFLDVASENPETSLCRKRIAHDDDTWGFNYMPDGNFLVINENEVESSFRLTSINEMRSMLQKALHNTGINRIWPMVRDVILINPINKWSYVTMVPFGLTVLDMIREILPHAKSSHFQGVKVNNQSVVPQSIPPGHDSVMIAFVPVYAECNVKLDDGSVVGCQVDVTTTVKDLKNQLNTSTGLSTDSMMLCHKDHRLQAGHFICQCNSPDFHLRVGAHVQIPRDIPVAVSKPQLFMPPSHSDVMIPVTSSMVRFVIRHPIWSTVRTVACSVDDTIDVMLKKLLPDMASTCDLTMRCVDSGIINDLQVKSLNMTNTYEVVFGCTRPFPVAQVEIVPFTNIEEQMCIGTITDHEINSYVKIWVRSPFQTKPYEKYFLSDMTAQHVAGMYFAHSQSSQNIMVMLDGKLIDPRIRIGLINKDKVLTFRAAPLLGGAKEKDKDVKKILTDQFQSRGVPEDLISSRVDGFLAKVSADKVRTHSGETWARQWVSIKSLANEAHFRLITTDELRAFQTKKKSDKSQDGVSSVSTKSSAGSSVSQRANFDQNARKLNLSEIRLDLSYFKAEGSTLKQLQSEEFGPDGCGITVMHADSAQKFLPVKRLSADPLAIVAIGGKNLGDQAVRMAPAMNAKNEPILVPFTIFNYGDTEVVFNTGSMKAELTTQNAMVVEFTILREEVEKWEDARSALVYLGQKIGETKTAKVFSSWAVKAYSKERKQCDHQHAAYVHGYLRVLESQADPLLARSGWYGIYLVPKNSWKKPHESYSIVAVPSKTIDEMKAIVQSTKNALGIVRTSNALAVRCRREHTYTIKKIIFPELPLQEEGAFEPGDKLYVLKHLEAHTNTSELTAALKSLGWSDAKALKPLGPNSWSIAAPSDPPAAHVCLNNSFVVIAAQGRSNILTSYGVKVPPTAAFVTGSTADVAKESTSSRLDELKVDLQGQVQALVDAKFQESKKEIGVLKQSIGQAKESIEQIKTVQANTEKKVQEVENTVKSSSEGLLSQLTSMFGDLQNNLNSRLDKLESNQNNEEKDSKRPRH